MPRRTYERKCEQCGEVWEAAWAGTRWCSDVCRRLARNDQRRAQRAATDWPAPAKRKPYTNPSKPLEHSVALDTPDTITIEEWRRLRGVG
jgi:predicted nucleic acid-binding Zn ribbon protein